MSFYDLSKSERDDLVKKMNQIILLELQSGIFPKLELYCSHEDTYVRKTAYLAIGRIYLKDTTLQKNSLSFLHSFFGHESYSVRQTVINAAGEIGKRDFESVVEFFDKGLFDTHHAPRNAVIGSIKKMGEVNPIPVLAWARQYLHHPDKEIRREICHGIELRGRTYPEDILPLLRELQHDSTRRVRDTLVHVLGQIAYKTGCLEKVVEDLKCWENEQLVQDALEEIIDVHDRYRDFAIYSQKEAREYIRQHFYSI